MTKFEKQLKELNQNYTAAGALEIGKLFVDNPQQPYSLPLALSCFVAALLQGEGDTQAEAQKLFAETLKNPNHFKNKSKQQDSTQPQDDQEFTNLFLQKVQMAVHKHVDALEFVAGNCNKFNLAYVAYILFTEAAKLGSPLGLTAMAMSSYTYMFGLSEGEGEYDVHEKTCNSLKAASDKGCVLASLTLAQILINEFILREESNLDEFLDAISYSQKALRNLNDKSTPHVYDFFYQKIPSIEVDLWYTYIDLFTEAIATQRGVTRMSQYKHLKELMAAEKKMHGKTNTTLLSEYLFAECTRNFATPSVQPTSRLKDIFDNPNDSPYYIAAALKLAIHQIFNGRVRGIGTPRSYLKAATTSCEKNQISIEEAYRASAFIFLNNLDSYSDY